MFSHLTDTVYLEQPTNQASTNQTTTKVKFSAAATMFLFQEKCQMRMKTPVKQLKDTISSEMYA